MMFEEKVNVDGENSYDGTWTRAERESGRVNKNTM